MIRDLGPVPHIVSMMPPGLPPREFEEAMTDMLIGQWVRFMTSSERGVAESFSADERKDFLLSLAGRPSIDGIDPALKPILADMLDTLDSLILKQAETSGSRLFSSYLVRIRLDQWNYEGPPIQSSQKAKRSPISKGRRLIRGFCGAWERASDRFQGKLSPPLDDLTAVPARLNTIEDLKIVLKKFQERENAPRTQSEMQRWWKSVVEAPGQNLEYLHMHLDSWMKFFSETPLDEILPLCMPRDAGPLWDKWYAWPKRVKAGSVRDKHHRMKKTIKV
jgi:hypothetical protein